MLLSGRSCFRSLLALCRYQMGKSMPYRLAFLITARHSFATSSVTRTAPFVHLLSTSTVSMQSKCNMSEKLTLFDAMGVTGKYKFSIGAPGPADLKKVAAIMERVAAQRMKEEKNTEGASLLQYGAPLGDPRSIRALAKFLAAEYGMPVSESHLAFTSGATAGFLHILLQMFPNKCTVYAEGLAYHVALQMLRDFNFKIRSVPNEVDGINVDRLEEIWAKDLKEVSTEEQSKKPYQALFYTVPIFHNPTGTILSPAKCERVVKLARKYHVLILSEDVYNMLYYDGSTKPPKRLFAYDSQDDPDYGVGHVVSNCTFSKLLSPGLRLGWQELPVALREKYYDKSSVIVSGGGLNPVIGGCVTLALEDGTVSKFISEIRTSHAKKMEMTIEMLNRLMPSSCKLYHPSNGGYFLYVILPSKLNAVEFVKYAKEKYGISLQEGFKFQSSTEDFVKELSNGFRISIPYPTFEEMRDGVHYLCEALKECIKE
uniref:Aminotransferase class I/classII large domain-containing protein n=1 Tax=Ascaris suum TaxID=6253 RepID=F1KUP4_ASCSU